MKIEIFIKELKRVMRLYNINWIDPQNEETDMSYVRRLEEVNDKLTFQFVSISKGGKRKSFKDWDEKKPHKFKVEIANTTKLALLSTRDKEDNNDTYDLLPYPHTQPALYVIEWHDKQIEKVYFNDKLKEIEKPENISDFYTLEFYTTSKKYKRTELKDFIKKLMSDREELDEQLDLDLNVHRVTSNYDTQIHRLCALTMAKQVSYNIFKNLHGAKQVLFDEEFDKYISKCTTGALMYSEECEFSEYNSMDINSMYPSIYLDDDFQFPIAQGKVEPFDKIDNKLAFYKVKVNSQQCGKFIRKNETNIYTSNDLKAFKLHNIDYTFLSKDRYVYDESVCIRPSFFLKKTIEELFEMKCNGSFLAKEITNKIWGSLSQEFYHNIKQSDPQFEKFLKENRVREWHPELKYTEFYDVSRPFKTTLCRIKCFILSYARLQISGYVKKIIDMNYDVIRIHTDSITTDMPVRRFNKYICTVGRGLGDFKAEVDKIDPNKKYHQKNINKVIEI